ncbi:acyltransferase [Pedobacter sp. GR22-6]|uniref:acyltransferase n=1 Tax=Pedobacter sp. GR22-6 TaxID=3127957 RepID=UPI00307F8668
MNNSKEQPGKQNFDFVDTIRCIAMIGIVFEHSTTLGWFKYTLFSEQLLQASVMEFFKFATISFFLISGFLINHKFAEYTPYQYLKNRFKSTIGPWALWLNIFILINIAGLLVKEFKGAETPLSNGNFGAYLSDLYFTVITATSFWFILNFLICIAILLLFKKYLFHVFFGCILALSSVFYSVNIYYGWVAVGHTTALFGFVFYLWLGAFMNKHYAVIDQFIKRTKMIWFVIAATLAFMIANLEIIHLKNMDMEGAYNTLTISNIIYSLCFFALLLKIGPIDFINKKFEPRKTTYGIYLIHHIVLTYLISELFRPLHIPLDSLTVYEAVAYSILRFMIAYLITMLIVKGILRTSFKWTIGS